MKSVQQFIVEWRSIAVTTLISVVGGVATFVWMVDQVQVSIAARFVEVSASGSASRALSAGIYELSRPASWLIAGAIWLLGSGTLFAFVLAARQVRAGDKGGEQRAYKDAYYNCCAATNRIFNQLYRETIPPKHHLKTIVTTLTIDGHGTTAVLEEVCITPAFDDPVHFWKRGIKADPDSTEVNILDDIKYSVRDVDQDTENTRVTFLPSKEDPRDKELCLFFLPQIDSGQERNLEIHFKWPRFFCDLVDKDAATYSFDYKGVPGKSTMLKGVFKFDVELGPIDCEDQSPIGLGSTIVQETSTEGHTVWTFTVPDAPLAGETYQLRFSRPRPSSTATTPTLSGTHSG